MDETTLADLKQFIAATVSQQTADIIVRLDGIDTRLDGIDTRLDSVEGKIDDLSVAVAEALENSNQANDEQLKNHELRIARVEHKTV